MRGSGSPPFRSAVRRYSIGSLRSCRRTIVEEADDKLFTNVKKLGKGSPYSITERTVPELIPVLGSQLAGDVSHKPDGMLPLLSARPAVTFAALKRAANSFAAW